jgi:hypothetical protein
MSRHLGTLLDLDTLYRNDHKHHFFRFKTGQAGSQARSIAPCQEVDIQMYLDEPEGVRGYDSLVVAWLWRN